jgi:hypothetical protein
LKLRSVKYVARDRRRWEARRLRGISGCCVGALLLTAAFPRSATGQELYAIVAEPPYAGYVVKIRIQTGDVIRLFPTGVPAPAGLTYDPVRDVLLTIGSESGQVYRIDLEHEKASPLFPVAKGAQKSTEHRVRGLAYKRHGDLLYVYDWRGDKQEIVSLVATTGVEVPDSTTEAEKVTENSADMDRLAVRPSDGKLFGAGGPLPQNATNCGDSFRVTGMDFHPETGDLYVAYDRTLVVLDSTTRQVKVVPALANGARNAYLECGLVSIDPASGKPPPVEPLASDIGPLGGIAFVRGPAPDVWIKDCDDDDGTVPSSSTHCEDTSASPDIWIENQINRRADAPLFQDQVRDRDRQGRDVHNWLYARVRNRSERDAPGTALTFYYWECDGAQANQVNSKKLIDECEVDVPAQSTAFARVRWRNLFSLPSNKKWCVEAVLDHPDDRVRLPATKPAEDNNIAVTDTEELKKQADQHRPRKRAVLKPNERHYSSYPGEREGEELNGYPIAYAKRPLVMQRGMVRTTTSLGVKKAGLSVDLMDPDEKSLFALDAGFAFAVHRNIEVGVSNYRLGSTPPKTGQGLVSLTWGEQKPVHWGDMPIYGRFRFVDRTIWQVAADLGLVFPINTKLASTFGLPIRVRPRDYDLAIDWGVEVTLLTMDFGANIDLPVRLTYSITSRGFIFGSFGLSLQQLGRGRNSEDTRDSNVAFPAPVKNQYFVPMALGGGYTARCRKKRRWMVDLFGQGGFNPLIYFNPPNAPEAAPGEPQPEQIQQVPLSKSWFINASANFYFDPVVR